jgi:SdpI/YfhL protein family
MDVIPVPEIAVAVVVVVAMLGARALWGVNPVPLIPGTGTLRRRQEGMEGTQQMRARLIASCVMWVLISVPLILKLVPPNGIYGFRIPATQASRAIWYPANAFMGWALSAAAVVSATLLLALPPTAKRPVLWAAFLAPMFGAIAASFLYMKYFV